MIRLVSVLAILTVTFAGTVYDAKALSVTPKKNSNSTIVNAKTSYGVNKTSNINKGRFALSHKIGNFVNKDTKTESSDTTTTTNIRTDTSYSSSTNSTITSLQNRIASLEQTISRLEQQLNKKADKEIVELLQEENDEIKSDVDLVKSAAGEVTLNEDVRNEIVTVATSLQNATKEELNRKLESYTPTNELRDSLIAKGFLTGNNLDNYLGANKTVSDLKQKIKTNNTTTSVVSEDLANNYLTKADFNAFKENNTNTINSKISNVNTVLAKAVTTDNLEDKLSSSVAFSKVVKIEGLKDKIVNSGALNGLIKQDELAVELDSRGFVDTGDLSENGRIATLINTKISTAGLIKNSELASKLAEAKVITDSDLKTKVVNSGALTGLLKTSDLASKLTEANVITDNNFDTKFNTRISTAGLIKNSELASKLAEAKVITDSDLKTKVVNSGALTGLLKSSDLADNATIKGLIETKIADGNFAKATDLSGLLKTSDLAAKLSEAKVVTADNLETKLLSSGTLVDIAARIDDIDTDLTKVATSTSTTLTTRVSLLDATSTTTTTGTVKFRKAAALTTTD